MKGDLSFVHGVFLNFWIERLGLLWYSLLLIQTFVVNAIAGHQKKENRMNYSASERCQIDESTTDDYINMSHFYLGEK